MSYNVVEHILSLLPEHVAATKTKTTKGLLFVPNSNFRIGPRYLVSINFPLDPAIIDWKMVSPFLNGANEEVCRDFFKTCNGFSVGGQFTSWGILTHNAHTIDRLASHNVPYDLVGNGYGSYPKHAPKAGYFIGKLRENREETEFTDIVLPDGNIISGEFRENSHVVETFPDFSSWVENRVPRALASMEEMGKLGVSSDLPKN